jgi:hypothetical protein
MRIVAFLLSVAQPVDECSSTDDVCLLQLKTLRHSLAAEVEEKDDQTAKDDQTSLLDLSSETDSEKESSETDSDKKWYYGGWSPQPASGG